MSPGLLLIDKPLGPTSRRVLDGLERRLGLGALGHAGTLDPLATGLLVVLVGSARRLQSLFLGSTKRYEGLIRLGWTSLTHDAEGPVSPGETTPPDTLDLAGLARAFRGEIEQVPPAHSAVHVGGRRAWRVARGGERVEIPSRRVTIERLELARLDAQLLRFEVTCSAGTYVRSLARDLGERIGCGAYLAALRRTGSGFLEAADAPEPEATEVDSVLPLSRILDRFARLDVASPEAALLARGTPIEAPSPPGEAPAFAWFEGEPFCRLKELPEGRLRSDLRLVDPLGGASRSDGR